MFKLSPSILSADFSKLGEQVKRVTDAGAQYLHIDVMDGFFVPSISFGSPVIKGLRKKTDLVFDVHLMVEEPIRCIQEMKESGADIITVHAESCRHLDRTITEIRELGCQAGVALNPATPISFIAPILETVDLVLIMTVNPGYGGQKLIPYTLDKIKSLKLLAKQQNWNFDIEVDGGIRQENVREILSAGANVIVAGTAVFRGNIEENISLFKEVFLNEAGRA